MFDGESGLSLNDDTDINLIGALVFDPCLWLGPLWLNLRFPLPLAQVTHSPTGRRISHGYNPTSFVAIRIGPVAFRIASVIIRSST